MISSKIINIVSGKGGTGKSLFCAVLGRLLAQEGNNVLLVDLDIHVRGLTNLFYLYKKEQRKITPNITIADYFEFTDRLTKSKNDMNDNRSWAIERFYEVDLLPAVSEIEEKLSYLTPNLNYTEKTKALFIKLKETEYDYVIVDNRAGIDALNIESCVHSDVTISICEDDPISRITNDNLLRHLDSFKIEKVYTINNKVKFVRTKEEYYSEIQKIRGDYELLGKIPFDVDLFEAFGDKRFWDKINSNPFTLALAESWNSIARRENIQTLIDLDRFSNIIKWPSSPKFLSLFERVALILSFILIILYFLFDYLRYGEFSMKELLLVNASILIIIPLVRRILRIGNK